MSFCRMSLCHCVIPPHVGVLVCHCGCVIVSLWLCRCGCVIVSFCHMSVCHSAMCQHVGVSACRRASVPVCQRVLSYMSACLRVGVSACRRVIVSACQHVSVSCPTCPTHARLSLPPRVAAMALQPGLVTGLVNGLGGVAELGGGCGVVGGDLGAGLVASVSDMCLLEPLSEETFLENLRARYAANQIYVSRFSRT